VRLPRFQRLESWSHAEVTSLLESVLRGLPAGAALVLEVGDREHFISRTSSTGNRRALDRRGVVAMTEASAQALRGELDSRARASTRRADDKSLA